VGTGLFVSVQQGSAIRSCRDLVRLRTTSGLQFVDLTALVAERVRRSGVSEGMVMVQSRHSTAAILVNENEPLLLQDFADLLQRWAPVEGPYRHNDLEAREDVTAHERPNGHAHARALLVGASACLNVAGGRLDLGEWQSVFLLELDGPRDRTLSVQVLGVAADPGEGRG
jgi:secondary thiamine-phosphate synthase enzyme